MRFENLLEKTTTTLKSTASSISDTYESHVRKKAVKQVSKTLKESNMKQNDYETMLNDAIKDINSTYSKKAAQVGLSLIGFNFIFGI